MRLTVFADASHCPETFAAGWGAWAKGDGWPTGVTFGGEIKARVINSAEAEMAAMANALVRLHNRGVLAHLDLVMLQSDCLRALQLLLQSVPRAESSDHRDGAQVRQVPLSPTPMEQRGIDVILDVLGGCRSILLRHVKGHKAGEGRQWVNRTCDDIARQHMRAQRVKKGGTNPAKKKTKRRKKCRSSG